MATCLKCDNCNAVVAEGDETLERWWSLGRYGSEWVDEPGRPPKPPAPIVMHSVIIDNRGEQALVDSEDQDDLDNAMMEEYLAESQGIAVGLTLHFCKATCLEAWAIQAAAFDN